MGGGFQTVNQLAKQAIDQPNETNNNNDFAGSEITKKEYHNTNIQNYSDSLEISAIISSNF